MPYLHSLATQCSYFSSWNEANSSHDSLTHYIGETSGVSNTKTVNDCSPSSTCRSTDNNIFRQVRPAGGTARSYVEGGTVAIFVWYDEDHPVPNLTIAPTSHKGKITAVTGSHASLLKTVESLLGLSVMNQGQLPSATNLRSTLGI